MSSFGKPVLIAEQTLITGTHEMTVTAGQAEFSESVPHPLGKAPFTDFKVSVDGGVTFFPVYGDLTEGDLDTALVAFYMYADKDNIYFHYLNESGATPAVEAIFQYRLWVAVEQ